MGSEPISLVFLVLAIWFNWQTKAMRPWFAPATAKMVATLEYADGEGENRGVYLRFGWGF